MCSLNININSQGIIFDKVRYITNDSWPEDDLGFSSSTSSKYSLRKFTPIPKTQIGQSCVGWSTAYSAMSTKYNIMFDITDPNEKYIHSFDPNYIYSLIATEFDYDCDTGTYIFDALEYMENFGCKKLFFPSYTDCNSVIDKKSKEFGKPFKINKGLSPGDWFEKMSITEKTNEIKHLISSENPVIIGADFTNSIYSVEDSGGVDSGGLWPYNDNEEFLGGHAMCIIGYDDNKFGGSFEVMNSWGSNYGDNGFIWIRYNDLFKVNKEFYIIDAFIQEKFQNNDYTCYWGDCYSDYSHILWSDGERYEGEFKDGSYHGTGVMLRKNGLMYSGSFKNGKEDGYALIFDTKENKYYESDWKKGEVIDYNVLGFSEVQRSENDLKMKKLIDAFIKNGLIKLEDENILDNMDFDRIPKIKKTKKIEH
ncbi:hypothetical protein N9T48_00085 [bacterium]|nr:hypothetical protein [bacterium]